MLKWLQCVHLIIHYACDDLSHRIPQVVSVVVGVPAYMEYPCLKLADMTSRMTGTKLKSTSASSSMTICEHPDRPRRASALA